MSFNHLIVLVIDIRKSRTRVNKRYLLRPGLGHFVVVHHDSFEWHLKITVPVKELDPLI